MGDVDVDTSGPIFDGRAERAAQDYCDDLEQRITDVGLTHVRSGTAVFRRPTGYYRSRLQIERSAGARAVTDSDVVYGPYLEAGSRRHNFGGYHLWHVARDRTTAAAGPLAEGMLPRYTDRMG